jgi:uncharacterized protein YutE (UPF0331/DUF86 family)
MTVPTEVRPALLDAAIAKGLAELMRFRHVVRHLYAYELEPDHVQRLLERALELWPAVEQRLAVFDGWLAELAS